MRAGIHGVNAGALVERALAVDRLRPPGPVRVIAAGKAATAMAGAAARLLGNAIRGGLVVALEDGRAPARFTSIRGSHPVPTVESERAGREALALAASVAPDESLLVLLSGGGSAIMAVPASGLTLEDKRRTTDRLLKGGADIHALNTVRKHISAIKGGWLAAGTRRPSITLAISDVVGDDLSVIASGPTVPDATTFDECIGVLRRFGGLEAYPQPVVARLQAGSRGEWPETPKSDDPRLTQATATVIGGRRDAMEAAAREASARGYAVLQIDEPIVGEARVTAGSHLRAATDRVADRRRPACIVSSGETTVKVTGHGRGGRNQEFALALAERLAAMDAAVVAASVGTDGIDGPTDAAGAIVDSTTIRRALVSGLGSPERFLADNNAYAFFEPLGDLVMTGPTGTNVGDLQVILIDV